MLTLNISSIYAEDAIDKDYTENYNYAAITNKCEVYDPYESFNRKIFIVNGVLDSFILILEFFVSELTKLQHHVDWSYQNHPLRLLNQNYDHQIKQYQHLFFGQSGQKLPNRGDNQEQD